MRRSFQTVSRSEILRSWRPLRLLPPGIRGRVNDRKRGFIDLLPGSCTRLTRQGKDGEEDKLANGGEDLDVAGRTDQHELVKLSDSQSRLQDPAQDIRGLDVYDDEGNQIGIVEDLYVDTEEREVRFLDVGAGGFLGLGEKHFLIPVEAVADIGEDGLTIEHGTEKVTGSPPFDTDVVPPTTDYQRDVYDYYGYAPAGGPYGSGGV